MTERDYGIQLIQRINSTTVSVDEIVEVIQEVETSDKDDRDWEGRVVTLMRLHPGNPDKAQSLLFRIEALARLLDREGDSGWTLRLPDGLVPAPEPVFAAAGTEPLNQVGEELEFDRESFFKKALELD